MSSDKFSFMNDQRVQGIIERDYAELHRLSPKTATKSVIVLSGGVVEGLLLDALVASGKLTFEAACQNTLRDLIRLAISGGIITEDRLTDAVRNYRNLIHPGREIRGDMIFEEVDASLARSAVEVVIRDVKRWSLAEGRRKTLSSYLSRVGQDEREFLLLFAAQPAATDKYEHPFLKNSVYLATRDLIKNGVLIRDEDEQLEENQEKFRLTSEAIEIVEKQVANAKILRTSITVDFRNVAASGAGGGGAPPIQMRRCHR